MLCPKCTREMTPLFISMVCDYCDGLVDETQGWDAGYVVWRGLPMPTEELVFASLEDAQRWKLANGMFLEPIRTVRSPFRFHWQRNAGGTPVRVAERPVTIFPTRAFPFGPNRAYLEPAHA